MIRAQVRVLLVTFQFGPGGQQRPTLVSLQPDVTMTTCIRRLEIETAFGYAVGGAGFALDVPVTRFDTIKRGDNMAAISGRLSIVLMFHVKETKSRQKHFYQIGQ